MKAIEIININKSYKTKQVLKNLSLAIEPGEAIGLLGPNGAGKTTLLKIIAGLSRPDNGIINIFGLAAAKRNKAACKLIGMVPQENNIERELSIYSSLLIYAKLFGTDEPEKRTAEVIKQFSMQEWADKTIDEVSGGMARRAMIARAIIPKPRLLLLDEPSVGLDPDMRQEVWQAISVLRRAGTTVVITTHYMEEAEQLCDRIALLKNGEIAHFAAIEEIKRLAEPSAAKTAISLETAFLKLLHKEAF